MIVSELRPELQAYNSPLARVPKSGPRWRPRVKFPKTREAAHVIQGREGGGGGLGEGAADVDVRWISLGKTTTRG